MLTAAMSAPATIRTRRPLRSPIRPASGWKRRSIGLTAAIVSATPKLPAPSSSFAYTGRITSSIPIDMHIANSATTARTKGFVRTRSGSTPDPSRSSWSRLSTEGLRGTVLAGIDQEAALRARSPGGRSGCRCGAHRARRPRSHQLVSATGSSWASLVDLARARLPALLLASTSCSRRAVSVSLDLACSARASRHHRGRELRRGCFLSRPRNDISYDLSGGKLLLTGFAIYSGHHRLRAELLGHRGRGSLRSSLRPRRPLDFRFPQDEIRIERWRPRVWDYLFVSLTNSIAFSPTDTMPLTLKRSPVGAGIVRVAVPICS